MRDCICRWHKSECDCEPGDGPRQESWLDVLWPFLIVVGVTVTVTTLAIIAFLKGTGLL